MELFKLLGTIAIENAEAKKALQETSQEGEKTESKLGKVFGAIGNGAVAVGKFVAKGMVAGAGACVALATAAVNSYADYEQLVGGVETLFGTRGAKSVEEYADLVGKSVKEVDAEFGMLQEAQSQVMQNAANAYKTCGLSANAYMETATSLAAALNQSSASQLDSANLADQAITDMSDNANKMGTSMEAIQNAYNGFSKQNYTMLDNLKLGYGGTKEEMQRLLADAGKLKSAMGRKFDINNFADVTEAIHLMQVEMGISGISYKEYQKLVESGAMSEAEAFKLLGTTAKEANFTIAGSMGQLKGAWSNLLTGMADENANVGDLMNNLVESAAIALRNLIPRVTQSLSGISSAIAQIVPILEKEIPNLFQEALPSIIQAVVGLFDAVVGALPGIISAIQTILPQLIDGFMQIFTGLVEALIGAVPMLIDGIMLLIDGIIGALPTIIQALLAALPTLIPQLIDGFVSMVMMLVEMLPQIIQPIIDNLPTIIISIVEALVNNLPVLIQGLIQLIMGIVTAIPQIIQALVDAIPTIVSLLVEAVLTNLPAIIAGLIQVVVGIVAALPQIFSSLISAVPAVLSGIWDGIKNTFSGLGKWFSDTFKGAKDWAVNAWSDAKEKFNKVKDKCAEAFSNFKDKAKEKFKAAKEKAVEAWKDAKDKFNGVKDKVTEAFSNLKDKVSPLFSKAKENALQTWSTVKGSFEKIKNGDIVGAFSDLGSMLKGKFSSALTLAKKGFDKIKDIGKDLVKGLWNGINNAKDWVLDKIKGFGKGILNGLKSFFGIKSPSRVMRDEVGRYLAEGVAVGITANSDKAESAAEKLASNILSAAQTKLDTYKTYNEMTLAEEVGFWDAVRVQVKEGTKARLDADKKYLEAKKSLDDQVLAAEKTLSNSLDEIYKKIADRKKEITETFDLFEEFTAGNEAPKTFVEMKNALDSQIKSLESYNEEMQKLETRIGGTSLFEEFSKLGVESLSQLQEINNLSDYQLQVYIEKFNKREALAQKMAEYELSDDTIQATEDAYKKFATTLEGLGLNVTDSVGDMSESVVTNFETIGQKVGSVLDTLNPKMQAFATSIANAFETALSLVSELYDPDSDELPEISIKYSATDDATNVSANVDWHAKSMDNASILRSPTIFGYDNKSGKYLGGGEAGNEVVAGEQTLMNMIQGVVAEQNSTLTIWLQRMFEILSEYFPQMLGAMEAPVAFDANAMAGALAVPMNHELGKLSSRKDRGR